MHVRVTCAARALHVRVTWSLADAEVAEHDVEDLLHVHLPVDAPHAVRRHPQVLRLPHTHTHARTHAHIHSHAPHAVRRRPQVLRLPPSEIPRWTRGGRAHGGLFGCTCRRLFARAAGRPGLPVYTLRMRDERIGGERKERHLKR
jgi:hypothetical protein